MAGKKQKLQCNEAENKSKTFPHILGPGKAVEMAGKWLEKHWQKGSSCRSGKLNTFLNAMNNYRMWRWQRE